MQPYQRIRQKRDKTASVTGVIATLGVHALALIVLFTRPQVSGSATAGTQFAPD